MKQLSDMPGICKYCEGCLRLEDENFTPRYRCKDFNPMQVDWQEYLEKELKKCNSRKC